MQIHQCLCLQERDNKLQQMNDSLPKNLRNNNNREGNITTFKYHFKQLITTYKKITEKDISQRNIGDILLLFELKIPHTIFSF